MLPKRPPRYFESRGLAADSADSSTDMGKEHRDGGAHDLCDDPSLNLRVM